MHELGISARDIDAVVLSHGHMDHHGGLEAFLRERGTSVPVIAHPDVFQSDRYLVSSQGEKVRFPLLDESAITQLGAEVVKTREPAFLASDLVLTSGEIKRTTDFETGIPNAYVVRQGTVERDCILDDQALIVHREHKGLVIVTGCSHAGIVNTIYHAQEITGVESVHAVIGGFHLSGPAFEPIVNTTIERMQDIDPDMVCPMHCTGWPAARAIAERMPAQFVLSSVGTTLTI
jgi:7,8-dihydropterin-6-yl-methyl-4-(beta-D-ribofuranosyl)aminobenzene 5'-phosphate synthase